MCTIILKFGEFSVCLEKGRGCIAIDKVFFDTFFCHCAAGAAFAFPLLPLLPLDKFATFQTLALPSLTPGCHLPLSPLHCVLRKYDQLGVGVSLSRVCVCFFSRVQGKLGFPSQILKTHVLRNLLSKYVAGTQDFGGK